jgi:hypothetical protein
MVVLSKHDPVEALNAQAQALGWPTHCDTQLSFDKPELNWFVAIWEERRADRLMPQRGDMQARWLKHLLTRVLLFERTKEADGRRYRVRLMGTGLVQVWGDLTGKYVDEAIPAHLQPRWHAFLDVTLAHRAPMRFVSRVDYQEKHFLSVEIAAAPLADDEGHPAMVMCAMHATSEKSWEVMASAFAAG